MKATLSLLILFTFITCQTNKLIESPPTSYDEYFIFHNYTEENSISINHKDFKNLAKIDFNEIQNFVEKSDVELKKFNKVTLKRCEIFYNESDHLDDIYFLAEINHPKMKQYLGYRSDKDDLHSSRSFVVFNVVNEVVKSSFVCYYDYSISWKSDTRIVSEKDEIEHILKVNLWHEIDKYYEFYKTFLIADDGYIINSLDYINKKSIKRK